MISKGLSPNEFEKHLIKEYFVCGSINKVFQKYRYNLPISFAGFDRVLTKYKVVKSAGPNSSLSESLYLLSLLASYKIPLERVYHKFAPKTFQISTNTLHRILHYARLGLTRRQGVALIITVKDRPDEVLMGNDISLVEKILGNKGDLSLPMGHSKVGESARNSIARVLQNEVFTDKVVSGEFPWKIIPEHIKPVMFINIADIRVSVYKLMIPKCLRQFSSYKIKNIKYRNVNNLANLSLRVGVGEIIAAYKNMGYETSEENALVLDSGLNATIFALAKEPVE